MSKNLKSPTQNPRTEQRFYKFTCKSSIFYKADKTCYAIVQDERERDIGEKFTSLTVHIWPDIDVPGDRRLYRAFSLENPHFLALKWNLLSDKGAKRIKEKTNMSRKHKLTLHELQKLRLDKNKLKKIKPKSRGKQTSKLSVATGKTSRIKMQELTK